ncbi:hypothetical protein MsAg5_13090 [Methanosarcinaceae archaeon Ag5]|uniref:Prepilin type IV endopeptidase peptidase domain-containing protein n=1 Tax=Methanolapillus africanus TaxID=3028297 RepID=A0AAE4MJS0_9EURY|nr:hypothetical protein [Methanosarcinaceae archaeon Ag5]
MIYILLKMVITTFFLSFFASRDLKNRKVPNRPILIFFVIGCLFFAYDWYVSGLNLNNLVLTLIIPVFIMTMYKKKLFGGADCKVFISMAVWWPQQFLYMFIIGMLFAVTYGFLGRFDKFNKSLKLQIERGIPLLTCFTVSWIIVAFFSLISG